MKIVTDLRQRPDILSRGDVLEVVGYFDTRLEEPLDVLQELVVEALEGEDAERLRAWEASGKPVRIVASLPSYS